MAAEGVPARNVGTEPAATGYNLSVISRKLGRIGGHWCGNSPRPGYKFRPFRVLIHPNSQALILWNQGSNYFFEWAKQQQSGY